MAHFEPPFDGCTTRGVFSYLADFRYSTQVAGASSACSQAGDDGDGNGGYGRNVTINVVPPQNSTMSYVHTTAAAAGANTPENPHGNPSSPAIGGGGRLAMLSSLRVSTSASGLRTPEDDDVESPGGTEPTVNKALVLAGSASVLDVFSARWAISRRRARKEGPRIDSPGHQEFDINRNDEVAKAVARVSR